MTVPNLINPVVLEIEPLGLSTDQNKWGSEIYGDVVRTTKVSINAQLHWTSDDYNFTTLGGSVNKSSTYAILRKKDIDLVSYIPQNGDKIVKVGDLVKTLFIINVAYYDQRKGIFNLVRLDLADTNPVNI